MRSLRLCLGLSTLCAVLPAQGPPPGPEAPAAGAPAAAPAQIARIPVKIVHGRLVTLVQLSAKKRIACNLFVDYDAPNGLLLHNKAAAGIEAEDQDGTPNPITVHLPDLDITVAQREHGDEDFYARFTRWYSKDLGENAVVGVLGARVLQRYHVTFDLAAGFMELSPPHGKEPEPPPVPGTTVVPITLFNGLAWLPVVYGDRQGGAMALATSKYDSWVEARLCKQLGHPAGDIGAVRMAGIALSDYVPLRPEAVRQKHPDSVFGMTGLNLLLHFRVEVDRENRRTLWTRTAPPAFAQDDLEFYRARATEQPAPLQQWLEGHQDARLLPEAADLLLDRRLDEGAESTVLRQAMQFVYQSWPADLKCTGALELVQKMLAGGVADEALYAGELSLEKGREDRYPDAVHQLRARMGSILLQQQKPHEAWKHLLSAAFGMPEDGRLNLDLARCYELEGRTRRAFSRYLQALLSPDSGSLAIAGLERTMQALGEGERFTVDSIEQMIEGRVEAFGVADKYQAPKSPPTRRVLLEQYGNVHVEGEECVELARRGLADYFGEHVVLVRYDFPAPDLEPLANPLSQHMAAAFSKGQIGHFADGAIGLPTRGKTFQKQKAFEVCRDAVLERLQSDTPYGIDITASADATGVRGKVEVDGPFHPDLVVQVLLVERSVLYPGRSKVVVHKDVARAALTATVDGAEYAPQGEVMSLGFDRSYAAIEAQNNAWLDEQEQNGAAVTSRFPVRIDPAQVRIVAILRSSQSGVVLQAAQWTPPAAEEAK